MCPLMRQPYWHKVRKLLILSANSSYYSIALYVCMHTGHDTPSRKGANSRGDGAKGRSQPSRESERNPPATDPPAGNLAGPGAGQVCILMTL